jgi:hypothetical protein
MSFHVDCCPVFSHSVSHAHHPPCLVPPLILPCTLRPTLYPFPLNPRPWSLSRKKKMYPLSGKQMKTRNFDYVGSNVESVGNIAKVCKEVGVPKFIHVSAVAANEESTSEWLRCKAMGEAQVLDVYCVLLFLGTVLLSMSVLGTVYSVYRYHHHHYLVLCKIKSEDEQKRARRCGPTTRTPLYCALTSSTVRRTTSSI